jgi:hypothetical protein
MNGEPVFPLPCPRSLRSRSARVPSCIEELAGRLPPREPPVLTSSKVPFCLRVRNFPCHCSPATTSLVPTPADRHCQEPRRRLRSAPRSRLSPLTEPSFRFVFITSTFARNTFIFLHYWPSHFLYSSMAARATSPSGPQQPLACLSPHATASPPSASASASPAHCGSSRASLPPTPTCDRRSALSLSLSSPLRQLPAAAPVCLQPPRATAGPPSASASASASIRRPEPSHPASASIRPLARLPTP